MHSPRAFSGWLAVLGLTLGSPGCSAIVQPDPGRLGGSDVASGNDAGVADTGVFDAGALDADLDVDSGPPGCSTAGECSDSIDCTLDACDARACTNTPDDGACDAGERCSAGTGCVPIVCASDAECGDASECTGIETCAPGTPGADPRTGCVAGTPPVCDDGVSCTSDSCDAATGCRNARNDAMCVDGVSCTMDRCAATSGPSGCENLPLDSLCASDGCTIGSTCNRTLGCSVGTPRDCRDADVCTADACDPLAPSFCVNAAVDADTDGAPARAVGGTTCAGGTDCNDANPSVRPGVPEICGNGIDDNCVGGVDEGCVTPTGENCATARPLVLAGDPTAPRTARINGAFSSFADDYATPCGNTGGRDVVFSLTVDRMSDVRIETSGVPIDTVLAVAATTCSDAVFDMACNDDEDPGGPLTSRIWLHRAGPTAGGGPLTVYILVDAYGAGQTGNFQLDVTVTPVHPDVCGTVEQLDITGGGLILGVSPGLAAVVGAQRGSCDPDFVDTDAEAAIFRLSPPGDGSLRTLTARSPSFTPMLYVRTTACSPGMERACNIGGDLMDVPVGTGGRVWVILDGVPAGTVMPLPYSFTYNP